MASIKVLISFSGDERMYCCVCRFVRVFIVGWNAVSVSASHQLSHADMPRDNFVRCVMVRRSAVKVVASYQ